MISQIRKQMSDLRETASSVLRTAEVAASSSQVSKVASRSSSSLPQRPGRGSASAWDKISFVVMPPLLQSAQLKPDVTITSADNEIDESDDDRPVSSLDHCSIN
nr:importin-5-like [Ipomoea batatas]